MDVLISYGTEVKAHDDGRVSGYLVRFGEPDASPYRDVFTKSTDYDIDPDGDRSTLYYNHGFDPVLKKKKLGTSKAKIGVDEVGVWIDAQLDLRDQYEKAIHELARKGKLGWSSGAPAHLVERKSIEDNAHIITKWALGKDASLTPTPADPHNVVSLKNVTMLSLEEAIKTLLEEDAVSDSEGESEDLPEAQNTPEAEKSAGSAVETDDQPEADATKTTNVEVVEMGEKDTQQEQAPPADDSTKSNGGVPDELLKRMDATEAKMQKLLEIMENEPKISRSGYYTVDGGSADPQIKSVGDLLMAVARHDTKRLTTVYEAKLQSTIDGPSGGFLIEEQTLRDLNLDMSLVSPLGSMIRRIPVSSPSGKAPIRHWRVTPAGGGESASASGLDSQKREEGGTYGAESLLIDEIQWDTTDATSGVLKATREQMMAAPMIEALLRNAVQEDVANKEEYYILRGTGAGQPLGVLNWAGTLEQTEATDNTFAAADSDGMVSKLAASDNTRVAWVYHNSIYTELAPFVRNDAFNAGNRGQAMATVFHGYRHFPTQHLPLIGTDGYIILGDWSKYLMFEWGGMYINFTDQRHIDEGKVAWYFGKNIDGKPIMPSAITLADGTFQISPFVRIGNLS